MRNNRFLSLNDVEEMLEKCYEPNEGIYVPEVINQLTLVVKKRMSIQPMWQIRGELVYGTGYGCDFHYEEEYKIVATFNNKPDAERYLKKAKLKNPTCNKKFKSKSLLSGYKDAWVEEYDIHEIALHDPVIDF